MITLNRLPSWIDHVDACAGDGPLPAICTSIDERRCDECNRAWSAVTASDYSGPDERGYVHVIGRIGASLIDTVLCPSCFDRMLGGDGDLYAAFGSRDVIAVRP